MKSIKLILAVSLALYGGKAVASDGGALGMGVKVYSLATSFPENVKDLKAKFEAVIATFKNNSKALAALLKRLKEAPALAQQQALVPEINSQVIGMFEKFGEFFKELGDKFAIPTLEIFEGAPKIGNIKLGDILKIEETLPDGKTKQFIAWSAYLKKVAGLLTNIIAIEKTILTKVVDKMIKDELAEAAGKPAEPPMSLDF